MERGRINKLLVIAIKYYPFFNSILLCLNNVCHYFGIHYYFIDYCIFNTLFPICLLYILSYVLHFCAYHKVFIHYMLLELIISYFDASYGIDLINKKLLYLQMIFFCVFLFTALYLYLNETGFKRFAAKHYR